MQRFIVITREDNVYNWTHLFGMVGSIPIRLVVEIILQVSHYVVLQVLRERNFGLQPPPGGTLCPHIAIYDCISNLGNFTKAVRNFYMDHYIN